VATVDGMPASRVVDVAIVAVALSVAAVGVAVDEHAGPLELLFGTVVLASALMSLRLVVRAFRRAVRERGAARRLARTTPDDVARRAVVEERARLAVDIEAVVRAAVTRMRALAEQATREWPGDPVPSLRRVQEEGQHATHELRRLLGLLREADPGSTVGPTAPLEPATRRWLLDVGLAAIAVTDAIVERYLFVTGMDPGMTSTASTALTGASAATVVLRRRAPAVGAGVCGLIFLGADLVERPVTGGFWMLVTLGGLAWSAAARRTWSGVAGVTALLAGVAAAQARSEPENLFLDVLIVLIGAVGGALVGWSDARGTAAHARAERRAAELAAAVEHAVHAERLAVARDVHDVVSHAVGVMAVQAGAAELLRPGRPDAARAALDVVCRTAQDTLSELDRLVTVIRDGALGRPLLSGGTPQHDIADLRALVQRMRAAGLEVTLTLDHPLTGEAGAAVYRIVQESLTNALRHACGAHVEVTVSTGTPGSVVNVVDDGPGPRDEFRRGYGLVGIAERVQRLGGQLTSGPGPDGTGFRVQARMPNPIGGPS
jgi:signal transduction histidine kinase